MKIVVMKFGGTSVADIRKIKNVASIIKKNSHKYKIVVVLSAMAGATNDLQKLIDEINYPSSQENDLVITSGEQVTVGLLSMLLNKLDINGTIVIGEGERDKAPMLYIGEKVGTGKSGLNFDM